MSEHEKLLAKKFKEDCDTKIWLKKLDLIDIHILGLYWFGFNNQEISRVLNASGPSISLRIKKITKSLKSVIWIRYGQRLLLTTAGKKLGLHCYNIIEQLSDTMKIVDQIPRDDPAMAHKLLDQEPEESYQGETNECGYLGPWR